LYTVDGAGTGQIHLHPSSVNFVTRQYESPWLVYLQMMQTSKIYVYDCTMATPYALLLFGGRIHVDHRSGLVVIDDWIK